MLAVTRVVVFYCTQSQANVCGCWDCSSDLVCFAWRELVCSIKGCKLRLRSFALHRSMSKERMGKPKDIFENGGEIIFVDCKSIEGFSAVSQKSYIYVEKIYVYLSLNHILNNNNIYDI